jgi:lysophospholipase L1-like esterase
VHRSAGAEPHRLLNRLSARTGTGGDNVGVRDVRVMFFGDSFVAGVGDDAGLGWVGRVVAGAFAAGIPVTAYNLGVRRETSAAVLERWEAEARPRVSPEADCRLVFSFGANDATVENGSPRVSAADSVAGMSQAIAGAARLALPVLVVGPPPANDDDQQERIVRLSARFAEVAEERGVPYVDVAGRLRASSTWIREAQAGDGAHPGRSGYALLAELVMEPWLAWLAE